ncbi:recombinase family protein [Microbacterium sp. Leaf179]|uniref:recombinase family protein n=1 Tax=Microbacterium sp. Leaf179 TaxID=1736288 RepID=UPI000AD3413B|nr:recombinase family protein [Microbacterium sp. Leaf179]
MPQRTQMVGYVRVSSDDQNLARQLEAIGEVDRIFSDKVSGGSRDSRTALDECIKYIHDGDTVRVASMDRLARSLRDMRDIVDEIVAKGAAVQFVKRGRPTPLTPTTLSRS